jgi:hypothetical protein
VAGMAHRSFSGPPEAFSPSFSPLCPWIHGPFPAIEFAVASSSSLPNYADLRTPLARASLNSGDFTAAERSGAARSRLFPRSDLLRPIQIERLRPRIPLCACLFHWSDPLRPIQIERLGPWDTASRTRALTPWPACQRPNPLALGPLGQRALPPVADTPWPAYQRSPARARVPSAADLISVVDF